MDNNASEQATTEKKDDYKSQEESQIETPIDEFDQLLEDVTASAKTPNIEQAGILTPELEDKTPPDGHIALAPAVVDEEALQAQTDEAMLAYRGTVPPSDEPEPEIEPVQPEPIAKPVAEAQEAPEPVLVRAQAPSQPQSSHLPQHKPTLQCRSLQRQWPNLSRRNPHASAGFGRVSDWCSWAVWPGCC